MSTAQDVRNVATRLYLLGEAKRTSTTAEFREGLRLGRSIFKVLGPFAAAPVSELARRRSVPLPSAVELGILTRSAGAIVEVTKLLGQPVVKATLYETKSMMETDWSCVYAAAVARCLEIEESIFDLRMESLTRGRPTWRSRNRLARNMADAEKLARRTPRLSWVLRFVVRGHLVMESL